MRTGTTSLSWLAIATAAALSALLVGPVAIGAISAVLADPGLAAAAPRVWTWSVLIGSIGYPLAIGLLATALAIPGAWALRARGGGLGARMLRACSLVPVVGPSYLAYAGWSWVRSPGTMIGDMLERGPEWLNLGFSRALAVWGLALWAMPVALVLLGAGLSRISTEQIHAWQSVLPRWRVLWRVLGSVRGSLLACVLGVALVMLGSPVPLHLAQAPTIGAELMALLASSPGPGPAWRAGWPIALACAAGAWAVARRGPMEPAHAHQDLGGGGVARALGWGVVALAVLAPVALSAASLKHPGVLIAFWRDSGWSLLHSGVIALGVGGVVVALTLATWAGRSIRPQVPAGAGAITRVCLGVLLCLALVPGVLVGSALGAWAGAMGPAGDALAQSGWIVVLAHAARFGFVGVLAGWWLDAREPSELRDARAQAGGGVDAWVKAVLTPGAMGGVLGAGLLGAALSLHEVESTVQVAPPGEHPALAQQMLDALHYLHLEQTAGATVNVTGAALILALSGTLLLGISSAGANARPARGEC